MLTRIEIDGFKSFLDFELDVPPFLALVGPNSSGKSNLLDALAFARAAIQSGGPGLSPALDPLLEARRGKPQELFHRPSGRGPLPEFRIGVTAEIGLERIGACVDAGRKPAGWSVTSAPAQALDTVWRQEVGAWHFHVPSPAAMRRAVSALDRRPPAEDAGNLAAVPGRMADSGGLDDLMVDLAALVPDVTGVRPVLDERQGGVVVRHLGRPRAHARPAGLRRHAARAGVACRALRRGVVRPAHGGGDRERPPSEQAGRAAAAGRAPGGGDSGFLAAGRLDHPLPGRGGDRLPDGARGARLPGFGVADRWRRAAFAGDRGQTGAGGGEPGTFESPRQVRTYLSTVGVAP